MNKKEKYIEKECKIHGLTKYILLSNNKYTCVKCRSNRVSKKRADIKSILVEYKGGKCEICGYNKCYAALEFHHKDPNEKDFGLASKGYTRNIEECKKEVDKCILVCANCHREIHENLRENIDKSYVKRNDIHIDYNQVLSLISENKSQQEIINIINVSMSSLKRFLRKNNISMKKNKINDDTDIIYLMKKHENYTKVGNILGVTANAVKKKVGKLGYPTTLKKLLEVLRNE